MIRDLTLRDGGTDYTTIHDYLQTTGGLLDDIDGPVYTPLGEEITDYAFLRDNLNVEGEDGK